MFLSLDYCFQRQGVLMIIYCICCCIQVSQLGAVAQKYQALTQNETSNLSVPDLQNNCNMWVHLLFMLISEPASFHNYLFLLWSFKGPWLIFLLSRDSYVKVSFYSSSPVNLYSAICCVLYLSLLLGLPCWIPLCMHLSDVFIVVSYKSYS